MDLKFPFHEIKGFLKVQLKYIFSFLKHDWELEDYPIRITHHKVGDCKPGSRFVPIPWIALVINWPLMSGFGNTKKEALSELQNKFSAFKTKNKLPRPGTNVPIEVRFASSTEIEQYEHIAVDFFKKILNLDYYECLITDESSLWDFHSEETNDHLHEKIAFVYEVDVADIKSGNLVEIFARIDLLSNKY